MGRPKKNIFAELGIDKELWEILLESVKDNLGTWAAVGEKLPSLYGGEAVSNKSARKWVEKPTVKCLEAACRYAAHVALVPKRYGWNEGYWKEFSPTNDPGEYMAYLKRELRLVGGSSNDLVEREFAMEEALCIGSAYMRMDPRNRELLRRTALQFLRAGSEPNKRADAGLEEAYEDLARNARAIRDRFGGGFPVDVMQSPIYDEYGEVLEVEENFIWPEETCENWWTDEAGRDDWRIANVLDKGASGAMHERKVYDPGFDGYGILTI